MGAGADARDEDAGRGAAFQQVERCPEVVRQPRIVGVRRLGGAAVGAAIADAGRVHAEGGNACLRQTPGEPHRDAAVAHAAVRPGVGQQHGRGVAQGAFRRRFAKHADQPVRRPEPQQALVRPVLHREAAWRRCRGGAAVSGGGRLRAVPQPARGVGERGMRHDGVVRAAYESDHPREAALVQHGAGGAEAGAGFRAGHGRRGEHQDPRHRGAGQGLGKVQGLRGGVEVAPVQAEAAVLNPVPAGTRAAGIGRAQHDLPPPDAARSDRCEQRQVAELARPARGRGRSQVGPEPEAAQRHLRHVGALAQQRRRGSDRGDPAVEPIRRVVVARSIAGARIVEAERRQSGRGKHFGEDPPAAPGAEGLVAERGAEHDSTAERAAVRRRVEPPDAPVEGDGHGERQGGAECCGHGLRP